MEHIFLITLTRSKIFLKKKLQKFCEDFVKFWLCSEFFFSFYFKNRANCDVPGGGHTLFSLCNKLEFSLIKIVDKISSMTGILFLN